MSTNERRLAIILGTLLLVWGTYTLTSKWIISPMADARSNILTLQDESTQLDQRTEQRADVLEKLRNAEQVAIPGGPTLVTTQVQAALYELSSELGLNEEIVTPFDHRWITPEVSVVPITVSANGELPALLRFIRSIEANTNLVKLKRARIELSNSLATSDPSRLHLQAELEALSLVNGTKVDESLPFRFQVSDLHSDLASITDQLSFLHPEPLRRLSPVRSREQFAEDSPTAQPFVLTLFAIITDSDVREAWFRDKDTSEVLKLKEGDLIPHEGSVSTVRISRIGLHHAVVSTKNGQRSIELGKSWSLTN